MSDLPGPPEAPRDRDDETVIQDCFPDNLPEPDELAAEIIENLEAGLGSFREVLSALNQSE